MLQPGEIIGDTYQLERPLGAGGMGEVWLARHTLLEEYRAIKIMRSEVGLSPQLRERFVKGEARNSLRLERHSNIVRVYDLNQHQGMPYIVMEFVEGSSLRQLMNERKLFSPHQVGLFLEQMAMALEVAHRQGMVHRDIKPANVLVDPQGVLKLTDFGLTKDLQLGHDDNLTATGQYLGTPAYMSPEQATGQADQRSDIYSLAAMVFEMLAGRPPFIGTATAILVQHATVAPPPLREFNANVPASIEPILIKALAKRPDERYRTALEFSKAYNAALDALDERQNGPTVAIEGRPGISTQLAIPVTERAASVSAVASGSFGNPLDPPQTTLTGSGVMGAGKSNTPLIVLASVLATLIVVLSGVLILLLANNNSKVDPTKVAEAAASATNAPVSIPATNVVNSTIVPATTIPPTTAPATTAAAVTPATTTAASTTPPVTTALPTTAAPSTPSDPLITVPPVTITTEPPVVAPQANTAPLITTPPAQAGGQGGAAFTAKGKLLFAFTQKGSKPGFKRFYLSTGREETVAAADTNAAEAMWTPDGVSFIYVNENEKSINQVVGNSISRLATGLYPSFSSDGQKLIYVGGDGQIVVANADGSGGTKISNQVAEKIGPRFSPDNSKIAFSQKVNGQWQVWVMDADGGNLAQVTNQPENPRWPAWSPDGSRLTFNTLDGAGNPKDIWVIDLSGQNGHTVATGGQNGRPFWSADDYIFFNSDRDKSPGQEDIYAVRPDGNGLVRITRTSNDVDYYNPVWHP